MSLSMPRVGGAVVCEARVVSAVAEAPGYGPVAVYSAYLRDGEGLSRANLETLAALGKHVERLGPHMPFVIGGDFQMPPGKIAAAGLAERIRAVIAASGHPKGTCRTKRGRSELDYFYVSNGLASGIHNIRTVESTCIRTHVPVRLSFRPRLTSARALVVRKPPSLPPRRIYGPLPPPPDWSSERAWAEDLAVRAMNGDYDEVMTEFSALHVKWADKAERELEGVTGAQVPKAGLRGRQPRLVWRSIIPERRNQHDGDKADACRWLMTIAHDVLRGGDALSRKTDAGAEGLDEGEGVEDREADTEENTLADECSEEWRRFRAIEAADDVTDWLTELRNPPAAVVEAMNGDELVDGAAIRDVVRSLEDIAVRVRGMLEGLFVEGVAQADYDAVECWDFEAYEMYGTACALAEKTEDERRKSERQAWVDWVRHNVEAGAKNAHRFLQLPVEWHPTEVLNEDGIVTADPMSILDAYSRKYDAMWTDDCDDDEFVNDVEGWGKRCALERPAPSAIRAAAAQFKEETLTAYDGFHPRHYGLLGDEALEVVGAMIIIAELLGALPRQLRLLVMPMIPKPRKGHRAVAAFVSLYRLWAKVRKPYIDDWEAENDRHYLAAGKDRSPQDVVWRQAVRAETAVEGNNEVAANLLWDMSAFFERLDRRKLRRRVMALNFPLPIARLAMAAYTGPRMLSMAGALTKAIFAWRGVAAGCGVAVALTRVYYIPPFDHMVLDYGTLFNNALKFDAYFDDLGLGATGTRSEVEHALTEGQVILAEVITHELNCSIEVSKAAVVASDRGLAKRLVKRIGERSGGLKTAAPNLGIDFAPGRARSAQDKGGRRRSRFHGLARKLAPFRRLCKVLGSKASKIFVAGPLPYATYGAAVNGLSDQEVVKLRRAMATAWSPRARGRSLRMVTLLNKVPTHSAENSAAHQYCREVWRAAALGSSLPARGELTLVELAKAWRSVDASKYIDDNSGKRRWGAARGPIANLFMTLHRIGWSMSGPFTMVTDRGDEVVLTAYSPALVKQLMHDATMRVLERQIGASLHRGGCEDFKDRRACLDQVRSRLAGDRKMTPLEKAAYRSVLCDAVLTRSKAVERGYLIDDICPMCGQRGDSIFHRVWECSHAAVAEARRKAAPQWLVEEARRRGRRDPLYLKGLFPHPGDSWPRPEDRGRLHLYRASDACINPEAATDVEACEAVVKKMDGWRIDPEELVTEFVASAVMATPLENQFNLGANIRLGGRMYVDGSSTQHVFTELRRAASALVIRQPGGGIEARYLLPVWAPLPQSPQAAEYLAPIAPLRHIACATTMVSDCLNVVRDFGRRSRAATSAKVRYAGLLKHVLGADPKGVVKVEKIKAHRHVASLPPGDEREDAIGNAAADRAAKEAVKLHPQPTPAQENDLAAASKRAALVIRTIGTTMALFPPLPKERMQRHPSNRDGAEVLGDGGHDWVFTQNLWRCRRCLRCSIKPKIDPRLAHAKCPGPRAVKAVPDMTMRGHDMVFTGGELPIWFCASCGAYAWRRSYGLAQACPRIPTAAGSQALARIRRGQLPWINHGEKHLPRRRIDTAGGGVWCKQKGAMINFQTSMDDVVENGGMVSDEMAEEPMPDAADADANDIIMNHWDEDAGADEWMPGGGGREEVQSEYEDEDVFGHGGNLDNAVMDVAVTKEQHMGDAGSGPGAGGDYRQVAAGRHQHGGSSSSDSGRGGVAAAGSGTAHGNVGSRNVDRTGRQEAGSREEEEDVDGRGMPEVTEARGRRGEGDDEAEAKYDSVNAGVVGARAGPGGPRPAHATVATAAVPSTAAVATVVGRRGRVDPLQSLTDARVASAARGKSTRGPPSGSAEPLDSFEDTAKRRRVKNSPQAMPKNLGVGPSDGLEDREEEGDRPAKLEYERRRDGTDSPTRCDAVARHGDVATVPRGWERPESGRNASRVQSARDDECRESRRPEKHTEVQGEEGRSGSGFLGRCNWPGGKAAARVEVCNDRSGFEGAAHGGKQRKRQDGDVDSEGAEPGGLETGGGVGGDGCGGPGSSNEAACGYKRRRTEDEAEDDPPEHAGENDHRGQGRHRHVRGQHRLDQRDGGRGCRRPEEPRGRGEHYSRVLDNAPRPDPGGDAQEPSAGAQPRHGLRNPGANIGGNSSGSLNVSVGGSGRASSSWEGNGLGSGNVPSHAVPLPARVDRHGERRGADGALPAVPRPRRGGRPRGRDGRGDADWTGADAGGADEALAEWISRWGREPSWLYLPHLKEARRDTGNEGTGAAAATGEASAMHGSDGGGAASAAVHVIRGRELSPGQGGTGDTATRNAAGVGAGAALRGHERRSIPGNSLRRGGARARTSELESWLQRMRAEEAQRAVKRSSEASRGGQPSAAERLAALRRRIGARSTVEPRDGAEGETNAPTPTSGEAHGEGSRLCMGPPGSPTSIEDAKMHLYQEGGIHNNDPAAAEGVDGSEAVQRHSGGVVEARGASASGDADDAARRVAWHTVDEGDRLTGSQRER